MSQHANFVQVHLGKSVPPHLYEQLRQTRLINPSEQIYLILSEGAEADIKVLRALDVVVVRRESLVPCQNHKDFLRRNRFSKKSLGGFWLFTSERFYAIESFLRAFRIENIIHSENDVMLYESAGRLLPSLITHCPRIGVTMDADTRCVPGFVFIRDYDALSTMNEFIIRKALRSTKNDMRAIAVFMNQGSVGSCSALPVIPSVYRKAYPLINAEGERGERPWYDEAFGVFGGVFDAAALGQYLGGIDPKISDSDTRGFISETAVYDPRNFNLHWKTESGLRKPYGTVGDVEFPIFNLHIHSKRLAEFSSTVTDGKA